MTGSSRGQRLSRSHLRCRYHWLPQKRVSAPHNNFTFTKRYDHSSQTNRTARVILVCTGSTHNKNFSRMQSEAQQRLAYVRHLLARSVWHVFFQPLSRDNRDSSWLTYVQMRKYHLLRSARADAFDCSALANAEAPAAVARFPADPGLQ